MANGTEKKVTLQQVTMDLRSIVTILFSIGALIAAGIFGFFKILDEKIPPPEVKIRLQRLEEDVKKLEECMDDHETKVHKKP